MSVNQSVLNAENKTLIDNLRSSLSSRKSGANPRVSRAEKVAELRSKVMKGGYGKAPIEDYSKNTRECISSDESSESEDIEESSDIFKIQNDEKNKLEKKLEQSEQDFSEETRLHSPGNEQRQIW
ncbi:unnamed protein product [Oikopleura dioica]|uniref:Uncharacterized protein n=1 Tax=Oikopleura dioica TaxID=34765 RepID=E4XQD7_OIKDI|nr:unnamed protein product [Oikopleura dioica]